MRVQTEEWRRFVPGERMYKGKMTLFYNGEMIWDEENYEYHVYTEEQRQKWEVIMVLPGVEVIPEGSFRRCGKLEKIFMNDSSVKRIEKEAIYNCERLVFVKLSRNLEYIGIKAFFWCPSLISIFIPSSCTKIDVQAFYDCRMLRIIVVPETARLCKGALRLRSDKPDVTYDIPHINAQEEYALHRVCSSMDPSIEDIVSLLCKYGIIGLRMPNKLQITPIQYLKANPFANVSEKEIITRYISKMMG